MKQQLQVKITKPGVTYFHACTLFSLLMDPIIDLLSVNVCWTS